MVKYKILIGIPFYNEESNLKRLVNDLSKSKYTSNIKFIFLDDGSNDSSYNIVNSSGYKVQRLMTNFGYGNAVKNIFEYAKDNCFSYFIIFPGDYQRSFEDLKKMIRSCKGQDLIIGSKFKLSKVPIMRRCGNYFFSFIMKLLFNNKTYNDVLSGFKAYKISSVAPYMHKLPNRYEFDICFFYLAKKHRFQIHEIDVKANYQNQSSKIPYNIIIMGILFSVNFFLFIIKYNFLKLFYKDQG